MKGPSVDCFTKINVPNGRTRNVCGDALTLGAVNSSLAHFLRTRLKISAPMRLRNYRTKLIEWILEISYCQRLVPVPRELEPRIDAHASLGSVFVAPLHCLRATFYCT